MKLILLLVSIISLPSYASVGTDAYLSGSVNIVGNILVLVALIALGVIASKKTRKTKEEKEKYEALERSRRKMIDELAKKRGE